MRNFIKRTIDRIRSKPLLVKPVVSERYLLIEWINDHPIIDGAKYADTRDGIHEYYNSLPKIKGVNYTICRIYNVS